MAERNEVVQGPTYHRVQSVDDSICRFAVAEEDLLPVSADTSALVVVFTSEIALVVLQVGVDNLLNSSHSLAFIIVVLSLASCEIPYCAETTTEGASAELTTLCCDDNDTVGSTRTVESGSRCVLEHCHALHIVRVE